MTCFITGRKGERERKRKGRGPSKINVFAKTCIWFIGFRQNLTWTYYMTLGTNLRKNFSFLSKSKMAAGGQKIAPRYTFSMFLQYLDPVHRILTKFGMEILLDHRNKPAE